MNGRTIHTIIATLGEGEWTWTLTVCKNAQGETIFCTYRDGKLYDALANDRSDSRAYRMAIGNMKRYAVTVRS